MQLYRVSDENGFVMEAPIRTIQICFRLSQEQIDLAIRETRVLGHRWMMHVRMSTWIKPIIEIERLETPIALPEILLLTEHRLSLAREELERLRKPTPLTALGELLCDE